MKGEDPQMWSHLPITITSEITHDWKRQAAGRDGAALAKASAPRCLPLCVSATPWAAVMGFSGCRTCPGGRENAWQPKRRTVRSPVSSFMTSSLTVSLCCSVLENYPRQISGIDDTWRFYFNEVHSTGEQASRLTHQRKWVLGAMLRVAGSWIPALQF